MAQAPAIRLNDGVEIPQLGLGTWQIAEDETAKAVSAALDAGYRHIDTAAAYRNEEGVGEALKASALDRADYFITTKLWNARHGYDETMKAFDESMAKLGLDVLDLYLIHWPLPAKGLYVETFKAFMALKDAGRIRSIGVSNFTPAHLDRLIGETGVTPSVNQIELHPSFQQRDVRAYHQDKGIRIESWSPLGRGESLDDPKIKEIAEKHGKTGAQVVIRWHLDEGLILFPKSKTPAHIESNFDVFDFKLDADDLASIAELDRPDGRQGPDPDEMAIE